MPLPHHLVSLNRPHPRPHHTPTAPHHAPHTLHYTLPHHPRTPHPTPAKMTNRQVGDLPAWRCLPTTAPPPPAAIPVDFASPHAHYMPPHATPALSRWHSYYAAAPTTCLRMPHAHARTTLHHHPHLRTTLPHCTHCSSAHTPPPTPPEQPDRGGGRERWTIVGIYLVTVHDWEGGRDTRSPAGGGRYDIGDMSELHGGVSILVSILHVSGGMAPM